MQRMRIRKHTDDHYDDDEDKMNKICIVDLLCHIAQYRNNGNNIFQCITQRSVC